MKWLKNLLKGFTILLLIMVPVGAIFAIFVSVFAGMFYLLDIYVVSIYDLFIFVFLFLVVGYMIEMFIDAISKLAIKFIVQRKEVYMIEMIAAYAGNLLTLSIVDAFMTNIHIPTFYIFVIAMFLALIDLLFSDQVQLKRKA